MSEVSLDDSERSIQKCLENLSNQYNIPFIEIAKRALLIGNKNNIQLSYRMVSYNIFFDEINLQDRIENIVKWLLEQEFDVIALQEVSSKMLAEKWLENLFQKYWLDERLITLVEQGYGCLLLIHKKYPKPTYGMFSLPSNMGRYVIGATIKDTLFLTTHLESLYQNKNKRDQQLELIFSKTKNSKRVLLGMDSNWIGKLPVGELKEVWDKPPLTWFQHRFGAKKNSKAFDRFMYKNVAVIEAKSVSLPSWSDHDPIICEILK
jgi:endonuclease/exonuclease/phosphatase family metal-dependent hydrolase